MKIESISIYNFGSYEGSTEFDFSSCTDQKRIVVFGGKNGAGKTTLFTAIQVGLYGNYAFGFRTPGKLYKKQIALLINNNAKLDESKTSFVQIAFSEQGGNTLRKYTVKRSWSWEKKEIDERLEVTVDGETVDSDATVDFQNYLIHLIPPELMNLYFFDGENVVEIFLGENKGNIHDALMTLSGNDTFEILYSSLRKVVKNSPQDVNLAEEYSVQKDYVKKIRDKIDLMKQDLVENDSETDAVKMELDNLTDSYEKKGGVSLEKWSELQNLLKAEEQKREELNIQRKHAAERILPFLMIQPLLEKVKTQISLEKEYYEYEAQRKAIQNKEFKAFLVEAVKRIGSQKPKADGNKLYKEISDYLLSNAWKGFSPILQLSVDESTDCLYQISKTEDADVEFFTRIKEALDESIERSKEIREKIETSSIDTLESYLAERFRLQEIMERHISHRHQLTSDLEIELKELEKAENVLETKKHQFVQSLKSASVDAQAGKVMLIVEQLQDILYKRLIKTVETDMNLKLKELMRKDNFWQEVHIDEMFNVHIICQQPADVMALLNIIKNNGIKGLKDKLGQEAFSALLAHFHTSEQKLITRLKETVEESIILPLEMDFERLSKGEKQVFVMALYWSIMNQSNSEIPFVIDTPFARIDADHRDNITQFFFTQLKGQLLVMSTDEELTQHHLSSMSDQIAELYLLEYDESQKRTLVRRNSFFEV